MSAGQRNHRRLEGSNEEASEGAGDADAKEKQINDEAEAKGEEKKLDADRKEQETVLTERGERRVSVPVLMVDIQTGS